MAPPPPTSKPVFESEAPASNNLWIGNLSPEVSESELTALFGKYGPIDSITSYSARSYAFVYYKNIDDAKAAKEKLQGANLCGNSIKIEFAKPARPCKSLWVAGLNQSVSKEELEEEFLKFGKIQEFKFLKDRNTAYVDYVRLEDATQALKSMNGKQLHGDQIRVDFLRSQPSRREPLTEFRDPREGQYPNRGIAPQEARWMAQDSLKVYSESIHAGSKRHLPSIGGRRGDGQPSKVLWVNYPPSVQIDEDQLHNAMILFGEIERIKTFEDRNYAFVQFRSVDEARLAKEGLQGKLFSNPRISIEYSNSEVAPSYGSRPGIEGPIPDVYSNDTPFHHGQNPQILSSLGGPGPDVLLRPLGHQGSFESQGGHLSGPNWRRSSPMPGLLSSPSATINPPNRSASGAWDIFDASQLQRESKRSRVDNTLQVYDSSYPPRRTDDQGLVYDDSYGVRSSVHSRASFEGRNRVSPLNAPLSTGVGKHLPEPDYVWRGIIAKGGSPICRARCVPIGKGIESPIPDVVNCTARTGLDMLTKHYADAIGFSIAFFLPDSEADFDSYTEFLRYLGARNRAGVAKFDDGTTLFLVPPSDFLTKVLKVTGPARLYGVVLDFPPTAPDTSSVHPETLQQHYVDPLHQAASMTAYSGMPQEEIALPMQYNRGGHEDGKPPLKMLGPSGSTSSMNNAVSSQAGVTLTPELIATLASLLPANKLSVSESPSVQTTATALGPTLNSNPAPDKGFTQAWPQERNVQQQTGHLMQQFSSQAQYMPQLQAYQPISNPPQYPGQIVGGYNQVQDGFNWQQQGVMPSQSMASVIPPHGQISTSSHVGQQHQHVMLQESLRGPGMTQGTDPTRFYGSTFLQQPANHVPVSNEVIGATVQLPHPPLPHSSGMNVNNQVQERSALQGGGEQKVETEEEKNRRYQSTLLFAVNLLNKVQQPSGAQTSTQGS